MRKQVIVKKDNRVWDSIRDTEVFALFRVSEHMKKDHDPSVAKVGEALQWKQIFGKGAVLGIQFLESEGYEVEVKDVPTQPKD